MDMNDDETIDSEACAALLHCDAKTVEEMARQGLLPGAKFGKSWMFFRDQIIEAAKTIALDETAQRRKGQATQAPTGYYVGLPPRKRRSPPKLPPLPSE